MNDVPDKLALRLIVREALVLAKQGGADSVQEMARSLGLKGKCQK